jgi:predicted dehydrogenase
MMKVNMLGHVCVVLTVLGAVGLGSLGLGSPVRPPAAEGRFRIAIVGLVHSHGVGLLRTLVKNPAVELVGIADPHGDVRQEAEKLAPGVPLYEDYRKMLDEKKPEAAWSFVENDRHLEVTRECAGRGINVIFEKPMAASLDQARQMLELSRQHHIKLMINYQMAWWPENYAAYETARSGELGRVWRVRTIIGHGGPAPGDSTEVVGQRFWEWLNDEKRGGGALLDFTCYGAVWLRWYLGMPNSVYAVTTHTRPNTYKTNTNATVMAAYADNRVGIIEGSWDLPRSFQDIEVFGDKGSIYMSRGKIDETIGYGGHKEIVAGTLSEDRRDPVSYFIQRVRGNQPVEGMVSPEFNVDAMEIVEAARRSAQSGKPVSLPLKIVSAKRSIRYSPKGAA